MQLQDPNTGHSALKELLTPYCFGEASEADRLAFEVHLLDCDECWNEVQRLDAAIQTLRSERGLFFKFITPSALGLFGLSGRVRALLGGHFWYVLLSCFLYSLLYAISLIFEVVEFDQLNAATWLTAAAVVLPWMFGTSLSALYVDWKFTTQGKTSALGAAMSIFVIGAALLLVFTSFFFPGQPPGNLDSAAYPPEIAYIKDALHYLPYALAFLLLPFHLIVALQEELRNGRHRAVFALLTNDRAGVTPRGAVFPRVWLLSAILAALGLLSVVLTNTLFDHLVHGPRASFFMLLIQIQNFLYFVLGVVCLIWYSRSLDELKRECLAVLRDLGPVF